MEVTKNGITKQKNVIFVFDEKFPTQLLENNNWPPEKCFYCENRIADEDVSCTNTLAKKYEEDSNDFYRVVKIITPRCRRCKRVHTIRAILKVFAVIFSVLFFLTILILLDSAFERISIVVVVLLVIFMLITMVILGMHLPNLLMPKTKEIKDKDKRIQVYWDFIRAGWEKYTG